MQQRLRVVGALAVVGAALITARTSTQPRGDRPVVTDNGSTLPSRPASFVYLHTAPLAGTSLEPNGVGTTPANVQVVGWTPVRHHIAPHGGCAAAHAPWQ
jgi:hypothetical protein